MQDCNFPNKKSLHKKGYSTAKYCTYVPFSPSFWRKQMSGKTLQTEVQTSAEIQAPQIGAQGATSYWEFLPECLNYCCQQH